MIWAAIKNSVSQGGSKVFEIVVQLNNGRNFSDVLNASKHQLDCSLAIISGIPTTSTISVLVLIAPYSDLKSGPNQLRFYGGDGAQREPPAYLWNPADGQHIQRAGRSGTSIFTSGSRASLQRHGTPGQPPQSNTITSS